MPFLLMVFLTLVCLPEAKDWPAPPWGLSDWSAALTGIAVALTVLNARRLASEMVRGLRRGPAARERALRRYERGRSRHQLLLCVVYVVVLVGFGWGWCVANLWKRGTEPLPGAEILILAPFVIAQLLSWACFYDADRACARTAQRLAEADAPGAAGHELGEPAFGSRISYIFFQARQKLALVLLPVLLLIGYKELRRLIPSDAAAAEDWERTANWVGGAALAAVFLTLPWLLRLVLGLRPLPPGPIRDRLQAAARRLHFRCSNVLVWNTRSGMANAMVIGIVPRVRYVVFTDRLLEEFTPDEVEAVFGHEVGHVKHQHMLYYLGFLMASMLILGSLVQPAGQWLAAVLPYDSSSPPGWLAQAQDLLAAVPVVAVLLAYIFVVFGFLSRRCERQADVYGCRAVSCRDAYCPGHGPDVTLGERGRALCPTGIRTFIRALEKVAQLNGISRDRPGFLQSWQHSTIARRVDFLHRILADPTVETHFQRRVALVKWALIVVLGGTLALLVHTNAL